MIVATNEATATVITILLRIPKDLNSSGFLTLNSNLDIPSNVSLAKAISKLSQKY